MALVTCPAGHYYDDEKNNVCPLCEREALNPEAFPDLNSAVTVSGASLEFSDERVTEMLDSPETELIFDDTQGSNTATSKQYDALEDDYSTISILEQNSLKSCVAGWLVCVDGQDRGKSFNITVGKNRCARNPNAEICFSDMTLSSNSRCSVVYEPRENNFYILPEAEYTECNGVFLKEATQLHDGDELKICAQRFIFIQFCNESRRWDE